MTQHTKIQASLIRSAENAMQHAYAPYSKFYVGAALLDENNAIHAGCNVENAAYPLGVCAEASAISNMVLSGAKCIKTILLVSSGDKPVTPCGGCRQKIKEFSDDSTQILVFHDNHITAFSLHDLLPHCFSSDYLT